MSRRAFKTSCTVERPRQKGWWGVPEQDELEPEVEGYVAPARESARRLAAAAPAQRAAQVGRALTPGQIEAIRAVMRLFVEEDAARGVDPRSSLPCHRCQSPRRAMGSVRYDRLTFCNECAVEYEIARARGAAESPAEFCERSLARAASA
ncbi:MAG TPA: hypothetical protein VKV26_17050 [Dehalococcoidia bacterium]|nr:hypothetical protein [Dehalococcoidia bacterium]